MKKHKKEIKYFILKVKKKFVGGARFGTIMYRPLSNGFEITRCPIPVLYVGFDKSYFKSLANSQMFTPKYVKLKILKGKVRDKRK